MNLSHRHFRQPQQNFCLEWQSMKEKVSCITVELCIVFLKQGSDERGKTQCWWELRKQDNIILVLARHYSQYQAIWCSLANDTSENILFSMIGPHLRGNLFPQCFCRTAYVHGCLTEQKNSLKIVWLSLARFCLFQRKKWTFTVHSEPRVRKNKSRPVFRTRTRKPDRWMKANTWEGKKHIPTTEKNPAESCLQAHMSFSDDIKFAGKTVLRGWCNLVRKLLWRGEVMGEICIGTLRSELMVLCIKENLHFLFQVLVTACQNCHQLLKNMHVFGV